MCIKQDLPDKHTLQKKKNLSLPGEIRVNLVKIRNSAVCEIDFLTIFEDQLI
jgi:hypothetical protein